MIMLDESVPENFPDDSQPEDNPDVTDTKVEINTDIPVQSPEVPEKKKEVWSPAFPLPKGQQPRDDLPEPPDN